MVKRLSSLIGNINILGRTGGDPLGGDPLISGIAYDSRAVDAGFLFIALKGLHVDGHNYIKTAIERGASAILYSDEEALAAAPPSGKISFIRTENPRTDMAAVAAAFYEYPTDRLTTIGVTGTDGKTSTVYFIDQLLELCGKNSGFISTAACKTASAIEKNPYRQSTPEAVEINMLLSEMISNGKSHAVIEATSHGLSNRNNRLGGVSFDAGVFTNLSHEHLEFHGTFEQYRDDKVNLFRKLKEAKADAEGPAPFGVVNVDDENSSYFIKAAGGRVYTCSLKDSGADFYADGIVSTASGSSFRINIHNGESVSTAINLPGQFNIENVLEAFAAVLMLTGEDAAVLASKLPELAAVKGRMKSVDMGQPFSVLIDYAHTPGAFRKLFPDLRRQARGKLIVLFGSAGERDVEKRAEQGEIAALYSDVLVLTDEDPRGEEPMAIIREIAAGALRAERKEPLTEGENLFLIPGRSGAIERAFAVAAEGDLVVLLGKGHESSIIYKDGPIPWDEETAAEKILGKRY